MRTVRALATTLGLLGGVLLPAIGAAQSSKPFTDAWFWGVKGGGVVFGDYGTNSASSSYKMAPVAGLDWMITRTHGGLYVSYTQAFFNSRQFVLTNSSSTDTIPREIDLQDMRRLDVAAMVFPGDNARLRPYAGIGFSLKQIATATPQGTYTNQAQYDATQSFIQNYRTGFSPFFIGGAQFRTRQVSVFGQATASPAQKNFFLYNGKSFHFGFELGLRYNVGSSIDRN